MREISCLNLTVMLHTSRTTPGFLKLFPIAQKKKFQKTPIHENDNKTKRQLLEQEQYSSIAN
jgi:hypothetical protein